MPLLARFFGAGSSSEQPVADDNSGSKLVVRNTFFELVETRPTARSAAFRRAKTDTLLLEKEGQEEYLCGVSTDDDETAGSGPTTAESENEDDTSAQVAQPATGAVAVPMTPGLVNGKAAGRPAAPVRSRGGEKPKTTLMLRNLPNNYTRDMLLEMLDEEGFEGQYDFVYLPMDFKSNAGLGYAFVNLVDPEDVPGFWKALDGYKAWTLPTSKVCEVGWSDPHQGLKANIQRYRNSPVMHESVPDECKPVLFVGGVRTKFPKPNKALQAPRRRARH